MELLGEILNRGAIHFFASMSLVTATYFFVLFLLRRYKQYEQLMALVLAAALVFAGSTLREAYDVYQGQPLVKAFTDYLSWLLGCGVSVWAIYRLRGSK